MRFIGFPAIGQSATRCALGSCGPSKRAPTIRLRKHYLQTPNNCLQAVESQQKARPTRAFLSLALRVTKPALSLCSVLPKSARCFRPHGPVIRKVRCQNAITQQEQFCRAQQWWFCGKLEWGCKVSMQKLDLRSRQAAWQTSECRITTAQALLNDAPRRYFPPFLTEALTEPVPGCFPRSRFDENRSGSRRSPAEAGSIVGGTKGTRGRLRR